MSFRFWSLEFSLICMAFELKILYSTTDHRTFIDTMESTYNGDEGGGMELRECGGEQVSVPEYFIHPCELLL